MFVIVVFALLAVVVADDKYVTTYDNIDMDAIIGNERLFTDHFNCFMDRKKCTVAAAEIKKNLAEMLETDCSKCSDKQKKALMQVFKFLFANKRDLLLELEAKYDPDASYRNSHKDEFKE